VQRLEKQQQQTQGEIGSTNGLQQSNQASQARNFEAASAVTPVFNPTDSNRAGPEIAWKQQDNAPAAASGGHNR